MGFAWQATFGRRLCLDIGASRIRLRFVFGGWVGVFCSLALVPEAVGACMVGFSV